VVRFLPISQNRKHNENGWLRPRLTWDAGRFLCLWGSAAVRRLRTGNVRQLAPGFLYLNGQPFYFGQRRLPCVREALGCGKPGPQRWRGTIVSCQRGHVVASAAFSSSVS